MRVIVTRHRALVTYLIEQGLASPEDNVIEHATADDVADKHVIGNLPLDLASLTLSITTVPLNIPQSLRGKELSVADMREFAGAPRTYRVFEVVENAYRVSEVGG